jgi:predicted dehydrogenase
MIKVALIGTRGHYAAVLRELQTLRHRAEVVAYCGAGDDPAPLADWCKTYAPGARECATWREAMGDVRVGIVAGAFEQRGGTVIEAISLGVHVLCEKTVTLTLEDLATLRQALRPDVHLAGMMFSRYTPGFWTARQLIVDGAIGDVRHVDARKSYKLGQRPSYYHDRATYGGTIPWVGSHAIDWIGWFYNWRPFRSVYATHSAQLNDGNGTMERAASCLFELDAGRTASVSIDYFRPAAAPTHGDDWARVVGTEGVMEVRPESVKLTDASGERDVPVSCPTSPVADFLDHVEGKRKSVLDAAQTIALTEACLLARQSADERRVIPFAR